MKKLTKLVLALALTAVGVGGAKAQIPLTIAAGWGSTIKDVTLTGSIVLDYKNAYASINLISETINVADYPSYELVLAEDAPVDKLQFNIGSDKGEGYSGPINSTTPSAFIPEGATTINKISLQACNVENLGKVEIKSFYLIDKAGNKVTTNYEMPASWAADVLTIYKGTMSFSGANQWNNGSLLGAAGMELPALITINADALPADVQLNVGTSQVIDTDKGEKRHEYRSWTAGDKTFSVTIEAKEEGETIEIIQLQNTKEGNACDIKNLSATITIYRPITVGTAGYTTFSADKAVKMDGVTAYAAKYEGGKVVLTKVTEVPANTGVIIEAAEGSYKVPVIESATALTDNDLLVSDGMVTGNGSIYALAKKNDVVGFYKVASGKTVPKGKAYLNITSLASEFIGFGDETTGISEKVIVNSEKLATAPVYNLNGQRVSQPTKGLYIVNGKKVIIK